MSKQDQVIEIVKTNTDLAVSELIKLVISNVGMTELGARTYIYNARKKLGIKAEKRAPKEKVEAPKAKTTKEKAVVETAEHLDEDKQAAMELHSKSTLSFIPWSELKPAVRDEFIREARG